jgi:uncharacterized protein (DUF2141 family)
VYITKTNDKGVYALENLKPGTYYVFALDDKNRNLIVDSKSEAYGFKATPIELHENQKKVNVPIIKLDTRTLKLTNARAYNTYYNIKVSKNLASYKISTPGGEPYASSFGEDQANIKIFNTFEPADSTAIRFIGKDSINSVVDTVLYAKFVKRETKPESFSNKTEGFKVYARKGILTGHVRFNKPLLSINYDSILYRIDSVKTINFTKEDIIWDSLYNILTIEKTFDPKILINPEEQEATVPGTPPKPAPKDKNTKTKVIKNQLYIGKAAFVSIELDSSKTTEESIKPVTLEETGVILTDIRTSEENIVVQLLDKSFNIIKTIRNNKKAIFEDIIPAEYQIRLVIDKNNDGVWSPGNFYKKEEPEPTVFYFNEKGNAIINLKANWEIGPLLITF